MPDTAPPLAAPQPAVAPAATPAPAAPAPPRITLKGLRSRAITASLWSGGGFFASQAVRLGSNAVLAKVLLRDDFGLMALVTIFITGLEMFSDIGIRPSIVRSSRDDRAFIDTAWTIQTIRGVLLFIACCLLAYPIAMAWDERLLWFLPVAATSSVIRGFFSTAFYTRNRTLALGRITLIDLATQLLSVAVTVAWALLVSRSTWALVAGTIVSALIKLLVSHTLLGAPLNRFRWDRHAAHELLTFGRWIFLSTLITFLAAQVANLLYGLLMTTTQMGVFWFGVQLASVMPNVLKRIGDLVGFPTLAELFRRDRSRFSQRLLKVRRLLVVPVNVGLLLMIALAPAFFHVLFPPLYLDAGFVTQVIAVGSIAGMVNTSYGHAYLATGNSFFNMLTVAAQFAIVCGSTLLGYALGGEQGFLLGMAAAQWVKYPFDACLAAREGYYHRNFDLLVMGLGAALALAALMLSTMILAVLP